MEQSVWISLLSGAVGASLSAVLVFIHNNKKNQLDYITSERSAWRKKLKRMILNLQDSTHEKQIQIINELKTQLNPYGKNMEFKKTVEYFKYDGHIWDLLELDEDKIDYDQLVYFIELLLKYDWERSKQEAKFKVRKIFQSIIWATFFVLSIGAMYFVAEKNNFVLTDKIPHVFEMIIAMFSVVVIAVQPVGFDSVALDDKRILDFVIIFAMPYIFVSYMWLEKFKLWNNSFYMIIILLFISFSIVILKYPSNIESKYVSILENATRKKNARYKQAIELYNKILKAEIEMYQYEYDLLDIQKLEKRYRKVRIKKKRKNRPKDFLFHPVAYFEYLSKNRRIARIVKNSFFKKDGTVGNSRC